MSLLALHMSTFSSVRARIARISMNARMLEYQQHSNARVSTTLGTPQHSNTNTQNTQHSETLRYVDSILELHRVCTTVHRERFQSNARFQKFMNVSFEKILNRSFGKDETSTERILVEYVSIVSLAHGIFLEIN